MRFESFLREVRDLPLDQKIARLEARVSAGRTALEEAAEDDEAQRLSLLNMSDDHGVSVEGQADRRAFASFGSYAEQLLASLDPPRGLGSESILDDLQRAVEREVALLRSGLNRDEVERARRAFYALEGQR